jgi:hypothetical protein
MVRAAQQLVHIRPEAVALYRVPARNLESLIRNLANHRKTKPAMDSIPIRLET